MIPRVDCMRIISLFAEETCEYELFLVVFIGLLSHVD